MKSLFAISMALVLILMPFTVYAQPEQTTKNAPPVSQPIVPEGDFALELVTALNLGTATTETQAEDMLTSVGIAPKNGWIADYPMTPIIIGELQSAVVAAAAAEKLSMGNEEALNVFQNITTEFGLAVVPGSGGSPESQPPTSAEYVPPAEVNNYYYEEGPPVVTYYPPPWDYYYLYTWAPYPFWYSGFFFPGFFVLNDFDTVVVVSHHGHHHHHIITNHFTDPKTRTVFRVDPRSGKMVAPAVGISRERGFNSTETRKGAESIYERSRTRQMTTNNPALRGPSRDQVPMNREQTRPSTIERGTIRNRGSHNLGSFNSQNNMGSRSETNIQRPSRSFNGSSGVPGRFLSAPPMGGRESFGGSRSFGNGAFSGGFGHGGFSRVR